MRGDIRGGTFQFGALHFELCCDLEQVRDKLFRASWGREERMPGELQYVLLIVPGTEENSGLSVWVQSEDRIHTVIYTEEL